MEKVSSDKGYAGAYRKRKSHCEVWSSLSLERKNLQRVGILKKIHGKKKRKKVWGNLKEGRKRKDRKTKSLGSKKLVRVALGKLQRGKWVGKTKGV